ncbi:amino acid ABC transporter substrate-binding protein, partial [Mesorhizobium sp. M7A.F.Ca.AU.001.01.1.1]
MKPKSAASRIRHMLMSTTLIGMFAASAAPAFADVVKIGLLAPLTGPAAADGQEFQRGVQMAIDEANAAGGVAGDT